MKQPTDNERLLDEVMAGDAEGFRDASLAGLLQFAQQRRRRRVGYRVVGSLLALGLAGVVLQNELRPQKTVRELAGPGTPPASYRLVVSAPLASAQLVTTAALPAISVVTSDFAPRWVATQPGNFIEVGDDELLALALPRVAALVRNDRNGTELLFVSESSADGRN